MALAALDSLARLTATGPRLFRGFDGLTVDDGGAGRGRPPWLHAQLGTQRFMDVGSHALQTPESEVMVDKAPMRQIMAKDVPRAACSHDVANGIYDLARDTRAGRPSA